VAAVWAAGGKLTLAQLLRCRVRYFSDGLAVGSRGFVEAFFQSMRSGFSARRKSGARKMEGGDWEGLHAARALKVNPISHGGDG